MNKRDVEPPDLIQGLRESLEHPSPIALLDMASSLARASAPDTADPVATAWDRQEYDEEEGPTRNELIASFLDVELPETDALLLAWAEMLDDDLLKRKVAKQVRPRLHRLPSWLGELDKVRPTGALAVRSRTEDEETLALEIATPQGPITLMVALDLLAITLLEDAFLLPGGISDVVSDTAQIEDFDPQIIDLSLADARARITQALDSTKMTYRPVETDTWPLMQDFVEWQLRLLPEGGEGIPHAEWTEREDQQFIKQFIASKYAKDLSEDAKIDVELLVSLAHNYGTGDPREWGVALVERVLYDLIPQKVAAPADTLRTYPDILHALVRFSHEQLGWPRNVTQKVLRVLEEVRPDYLELVDELEAEQKQYTSGRFFDFLR